MLDPDGTPVAYGWVDGGGHGLQLPDIATFRFQPGGDQMTVIPQRAGVLESVWDAYRSIALPLALQVSGFEALHGSAVRTCEGVIAFCASSGTGKSTLAYGLSRRGHSMWADDAVIFEVPIGGRAMTHGIPFRVNLREATRAFFELFEGHGNPVSEGGGDPAPMRAVLLLERAEAEAPTTDISRLPAPDALTALIPHGHRFVLGDLDMKRRTLETYLRLVSQVPVLRVRFVPGFEKLPPLLDEIEEHIGMYPE